MPYFGVSTIDSEFEDNLILRKRSKNSKTNSFCLCNSRVNELSFICLAVDEAADEAIQADTYSNIGIIDNKDDHRKQLIHHVCILFL